MRRINWLQILITAIVTGVFTIITGIILLRLQAREPRLFYSTVESIPFAGQDQVVAIYQVSINNDGKRAVENVNCVVRIPGATIDQRRISADLAITYTDSVIDGTLRIQLPLLNPLETVKLSVLAKAPNSLPSHPEVSLRGKGVSGKEKSLKEEREILPYSIISALVGILAGLITFTMILRIKYDSKKEEKEPDLHEDDQRRILAYLCGMHGLNEEAENYLAKVTEANYWSEADRLARIAIDSKDNVKTGRIKLVLKELLEYAQVSIVSRGIINYNLARIEAFAGNLEESRAYLTKAKHSTPKLIGKRISIDPLFKNQR